MRGTARSAWMISIRGVSAVGIACVLANCTRADSALVGLHVKTWVDHITAIAWPGKADAAVAL